jgi:preprotein translocase subunit SecY
MIRAIVTIFTVPDLRKKILFTLGMLLLFRIGAHITVPGLDFRVLQDYFSKAAGGQSGNLTDYIDLFAGGAFKRLSVFALGHHALHFGVDHHADHDGGRAVAATPRERG